MLIMLSTVKYASYMSPASAKADLFCPRRNADPNKARSTDGATPLFMAAENDHAAVAGLLRQHGATT